MSDAAAPPVKDGDPASAEAAPSEKAVPSASATVAERPAYALAVLSGFLYFLAFPGIDLWPLSFVALTPLIVAMRGQTAKRAAGLGWAAGFTMTMCGFYWLLDMLKTFSGFPTPVCLLFMCILCGYQGGRIALMGWLHGRGAERGWPPGLAFSLAFVASELTFPLLFPWYFGATVHQVPALTQVAELGNPIVVGLTLVAANFAFAELWYAKSDEKRVPVKKVAALLAVPALSAVYGAIRIPQVDAAVRAAEKGHVGVVQANMSLMGKRHDRIEGLRRHLRLTNELKAQGPLDLVVWSETSVAGAVHEDLAAAEYPKKFTAALGVPAVFGAVLYKEVSDAREFALYNSALLSDAQGKIVGRFDKTYLLAFGEYLPLGETFPILYDWSPNTGKFTPGKRLASLPLGDKKLTVHICYEDVIPSFVNRMMRFDSGNLLVNITNDAWFGDSTEPWIHFALSKFRAIEQRRFLVRSTNSGVSGIVDPVGRVVAHTGTFREDSARAEIAWMSGRTPYNLWGDTPWWLCTLGSVILAFRRRKSA
ncbi:MAG TPA: apolipoprotein N-acyltransferase [Polyangiaceae bacterium]|nr:apolipoprotein N-acyltransferase [Polyangiaceae bacterium]